MMLATRLRKRQRRGMTAVEGALVMSVFLLLLFGMFEYCRFLLVLHVTNNAARDGARYAVVNLDKPGTFNKTNYTDSAGKVYLSVEQYTTNRMANIQKNLNGYRVAVYAVDQTGLTQTPPVIRPKAKDGTPVGTYPDMWAASDPNAVPWNSAAFTEKVAVTIDGTYRPFLPSLLFMPKTIPITCTAMMGSEG
jgi:Flp pilus assembly protein TadG